MTLLISVGDRLVGLFDDPNSSLTELPVVLLPLLWHLDPFFDRLAVALEHFKFSLYDKHVVTEEQIQHWADEAEAGYDVVELKRRGRGRPGRGAEPMQVVAVRLTAEELDSLDAAAAKNDMSRSEAIRAALAHLGA